MRAGRNFCTGTVVRIIRPRPLVILTDRNPPSHQEQTLLIREDTLTIAKKGLYWSAASAGAGILSAVMASIGIGMALAGAKEKDNQLKLKDEEIKRLRDKLEFQSTMDAKDAVEYRTIRLYTSSR